MTALTGMTWDHPRGIDALEAAGREFARITGTSVRWEVRPLAQFEDSSVSELARSYDLVAMDHPFIGDAVRDGGLSPLEEAWSAAQLAELRADSAGPSQDSYLWRGRTYAAAVDAACMVSAAREGALDAEEMPRDWDGVAALSRRLGRGRVLLAANPTHLWGTLLSLCEDVASGSSGEPSPRDGEGRPAWWPEAGLDRAVLGEALPRLRALLEWCDPSSRELDPITVLERLSGRGDAAYTPLVFGYVTYARERAGAEIVRFANAPGTGGAPVGTLTGGVGLAVSAHSARAAEAARFVLFASSLPTQRGTYVTAGGQSGRRSVWADPAVNARDGGFYADTLATMDRSFLRPRVPGYPAYQRSAAHALHGLVFGGGGDAEILEALSGLWRTHVLA